MFILEIFACRLKGEFVFLHADKFDNSFHLHSTKFKSDHLKKYEIK